jgi:hypothetical protein
MNRALCLMWTEVWRRPANKAEQALLDEVARLLWQAFLLDPSLPILAEWNELLQIAASRIRRGQARRRSEQIRDDL